MFFIRSKIGIKYFEVKMTNKMDRKIEKKKMKKKKKNRVFWLFVKIQIFLMILVLLGVAYYFYGGYAKQITKLQSRAQEKVRESTSKTFRENQTSLVYDCNGQLISKLKGEKDVFYLNYEEIPSTIISAVISVEDKKFYRHHGIDVQAILRAAIAMVRDGEVSQGGSTITQQLARTVFLSTDKTWERKIEEMFIALDMEKIYSKNKILEFYLNNIYYANGYYGIAAASEGYFQKTPDKLTLSESAFLCAIPNNPTIYNPLTNKQNTIKRRDRILYGMLKDGMIDEQTYLNGKKEEMVLHQETNLKNDYVETYIYDCATKALMEKKGFQFKYYFNQKQEEDDYKKAYSALYQECKNGLFTEGYRIYTSMDLAMQQKLQGVIDESLASYVDTNAEGIFQLQGAAVCIDNGTGFVKAIVGGRNQNLNGYTLNRGYQSYRQPGSAIKPIVVYTPILERGYTPDSIVVDEEIEGGPHQNNYLGQIPLRYAVEQSRNPVAWKLFQELTPEVGLSYPLKMNFQKIDKEDYRLPTALGGLTNGVSPLEMAAAYETIQHDGKYRKPSCIVRIEDSEGKVIIETAMEEQVVYKQTAARMMTNVLTGVLTNGTAAGLAIAGMPCAGKTGTTNDNKDGWFVGYTGYYTTSVWVGYDLPKEMLELQGGSFPAKIWNRFMTEIHMGLVPLEFLPY